MVISDILDENVTLKPLEMFDGSTRGSMNKAKSGHRFRKIVRSDKEQYNDTSWLMSWYATNHKAAGVHLRSG